MEKNCRSCEFDNRGRSDEPCASCNLMEHDKWLPKDSFGAELGKELAYKVNEISKETGTTEMAIKDSGNRTDKPCTKYQALGFKIGEIVSDKQEAYGNIDAVHEIVKILFPNGIKPEQYTDLMLIVRILDKVNRICRGNKKAFSESPYRDIAGYAILGAEKDEKETKPCS